MLRRFVSPDAGQTKRLEAMRDELSHALFEALYEMEVLPENADGALLGMYAVMDDLDAAMRRTERLDLARSA
ncbi:MAG: hypothetical protein WEB88_13720 [Gemmatimonadota bacterium]